MRGEEMTQESINLVDAYVDYTELTDQELEELILRLCNRRKTDPREQHSLEEITAVLHIVAAEKNSRSATKQTQASIEVAREAVQFSRQSLHLSRVAIGIAIVGVAIAAVGTWR